MVCFLVFAEGRRQIREAEIHPSHRGPLSNDYAFYMLLS